MAISHVCNSCGVDLTGVEPFVDASLNLPIVVCPRCRSAVVRRSHPIHQAWRTARRADAALTILALQCFVALALLGTIVGMTAELTEYASSRGESPTAFILGAFGEQEPVKRFGNQIVYNGDGRDAAIIMAAMFSAIAGVWLTMTLKHLPFFRRWAVWTGLALCLVSLNWVRWAYGAGIATMIGKPELAPKTGAAMWLIQLSMLGGCVAVMLIASPLGWPARLIVGLLRGSMWRRQLKRARYSRGRDE